MILAAFHSEGILDTLKPELKRLHKLSQMEGAVVFSIHALILFTPVAFFVSSLANALATSSLVKGSKVMDVD